jgi:phage-related protein
MEDDPAKHVRALFYRTSSGNEPVREWLKALSAEDRMVIGVDIKTVEFGWPIGMPVCRSLGEGIWEVRSNLADGRIARVLFALHENKLYLLHGFIKKTQKTPPHELDLARRRFREVMQ